MRYLCLLLGTGAAVAGLIAGCQKSSEGTAVRAEAPIATSATASPAEVPGVKETLRESIPPNAFLCFPKPGAGRATPATIADAAAPRVTISLPDGWTSKPGTGDVALNLQGPEGMSGTVSIVRTTLDPAAAFDKYADDLAKKAALSVINVRPAEFCGYSSQKLFGNLSGPPEGPVDFADRITHIWTNTDDYVVAIHLQAPPRAAGFENAKNVLMQDFAVVLP
ncbi:hypothetical protein [Mycobacterium hubeiense]|uniref:hypothetical protein n=1 Tax=Mycobacterium hubeiense TaxID=1867256 RepID=UPI001E61CFEF|nr:hypothetical protein [Mycobacterium sp. QGD 101]